MRRTAAQVHPTQPEELLGAVKEKTKLVFVETIANPVTQVSDLKRLGEICKEKGILYVVDSTMTSPFLVQPKEYGADIIIHSLTKFIGGHGNALGGALVDTGLFDWSTFSNIQDGLEGEGNMNIDPLFTDPENGDYHLQGTSPCIDAGNPDSEYNDTDGSRNNMGAYGGPGGNW